MMTHVPLFKGNNPQHQLQIIIQKLGCPPVYKLDFIHSKLALNHILKYEKHIPPLFYTLFPPNTPSLG